jgi:hypothetical protein
VIRLTRLTLVAALALPAAALDAQTPRPGPAVEVSAVDAAGRPVAGARVEVSSGGRPVAASDTDSQGRARFTALDPGRYEIRVTREGFQPGPKAGLEVSGSQSVAIEVALTPAIAHADSIEVHETVSPAGQSGGPGESVEGQTL